MNFPYKIIDLTHTLNDTIPSWNGSCGFQHTTKLDYDDCKTEVKFRVQKITMHAGIGTHIDAPAHCVPKGVTVEDLRLQDLIAPCVVIDVSPKSHERYSVAVQDIKEFEESHGIIPKRAFIIIRTGWEQFWLTPDRYRNHHVFPSVSAEAAEFLLEKQVVGLGIDTLSPDRPKDGYLIHQTLLGAGKYIIENVANSGALPPLGSYSLALPIKTQGGTEAPIRLIALINGI